MNGTKGVARSAISLLARPNRYRNGALIASVAIAALPSLRGRFDGRLGGHGAAPEPKGFIARLHDVAVVGQAI